MKEAQTGKSSTSPPDTDHRQRARGTIARLLGAARESYLAPRAGTPQLVGRSERARELLDWEPHVGLEDGLRLTAESLGAL